MLHLDHLSILDKHLSFLQKRITTQNEIFLVGGCIRDLLLGTETSPTDVDFTMAGEPGEIYKHIDKKGLDHFMTEKFGTITLIQKNLRKSGKIGKKRAKSGKGSEKSDKPVGVSLSGSSDNLSDSSVMKYELTPLRSEGGYEDFRHPGEIQRSNDLLLDSMRRDFTINCIYYFAVKGGHFRPPRIIASKASEDDLIYALNTHGFVFLPQEHLLILQSKELIQKLFADGVFQKDELPYLVHQFTKHTVLSLVKTAAHITRSHRGLHGSALRIIIDPHKGIQDLIKRRIRAVGNPDKRLTEDALRIIRAIRFVSVINEKLKQGSVTLSQTKGIKGKKLDSSLRSEGHNVILFDFIKETRNSIKKNSELVEKVAKERIKEELVKAFAEGNSFGFISLLDEAKLLPILFPALASTKNVDQPIRYHPFDVYTHTLLTLLELQKINADYLVRFAMLYHDVGKVDQFELYHQDLSKEELKEILAGPLNHRKSGAKFVHEDFGKLGFSKKEIDEISWLVTHHHKLEEILYAMPDKREKKTRSFLSEAGEKRFHDILDITIADRLGQYNPLQNSSDITDIEKIRTIVDHLHKKEGQFTMKKLAVNGNDIIKQFKLQPGPQIGKLLQKALQRVINDIKKRNTKKEIFAYLKKFIRK